MAVVSAKIFTVDVVGDPLNNCVASPEPGLAPHFKCSFPGCDAAFSKPCRLEWHLRVHNGLRPYPCVFPGCPKSYTRSYHLTRHQAKAHGPKPVASGKYICSFKDCGKSLSTQQLLDRHMDGYHQVRPYSCGTCHKRFMKHHHLTTHEFEHTGNHPYKCQVEGCGKGFFRRLKLERHAKIHGGYNCPESECGEKFEKWSQLRAHKAAIHRKLFECQQCKKTFVRKGLLNDHMVVHENQRETLECPQCHSVLFSAKSLKDHSKRCAVVKPELICDYPGCEKVFLRQANFTKHKALHPKLD